MLTRQSLRHSYKRRRTNPPSTSKLSLKKLRRTPPPPPVSDRFDVLPDDLVTSILIKLVSSAAAPSDLLSITMTCKRMNGLAFHPVVLSRASARSLAVKAKRWSDSAHRFLKRCADAGNHEALYILGMIRFYCLSNRRSGASLMAKAAIASHAAALYSLAVIQFNGSGGAKTDKDLRAGVALCARAAYLGHIDALRELGHCLQDGYGVRQNVNEGRRFLVQANARELGHCLQDGYGVRQNVNEGRRFLVQANARELAAVLGKGSPGWLAVQSQAAAAGCPLLSDFGWSVPEPDPHPANQFLLEWFGEKGAESGLRLCSHAGCGRPETRKHEFRRCSVCGTVNYCSRACQALDWKVTHKAECAPFDIWNFEDGVGGAAVEAEPAAPAEEDGRTD